MKIKRAVSLLNNWQESITSSLGLAMLLMLISLMIPTPGIAQNLLDSPQIIIIDADRDRLLVSNFGGQGPLVQIDPEGNQEYFVEAAGYVDGMAIAGDVVYGVGNNRKFYGYNLDTRQRVLDFTFPGSVSDYLSSVASDMEGSLFVSCPALHTIYKFRISDSTYSIFAQEDGLNRPNGILLERENDRIVVIDDSLRTSTIHAISLSDATVSDLLTANLHFPDGITRDAGGTYYVGGYYLPGLYRIDRDFSQAPEMFYVGSHMIYPTYDASDHSLLVTYYGDDSWGRVMLPGGILTGTVLLSPAANPEEVAITVGAITIHPDSTGLFTQTVPAGIFDVTASLDGYEGVTREDVEFILDQVTPLSFELNALYEDFRTGAQRRPRP